ncbi:MAG TPA: PLDc N-terminal domain-containing protein [Candidatus Nanoarchaeia archaeon]|nr:PLDc N-terminal domain-containing protein [Candidatus Nanoarchaeia archaeon]
MVWGTMMDGSMWFPFMGVGFGLMMLVGLLVFAFWLWMLIDAATRRFRNTTEKIIWIVVVALTGWLGALVYFIVIRSYNTVGLAKK